MRATYSAKELALILGKTQSTISRRAASKGWPFIWEKAQGGPVKLFLSHTLPPTIRAAIAADELVPSVQRSQPGGGPDSPTLSEPQQSKALKKADLLRLYLRALAAAPWGKKAEARDDFMTAYNSGIAWPELFKAIGLTSWKTIEGWKKTVENHDGDCFHLADRRGHAKKGRLSITTEQTDILLRCALHPNRPRISEAIRMARANMHHQQIANGHSEATYRRWLNNWADHNYHIWVFHREGAKAWNEKCAKYIERNFNLINVGDVIVADGHVLNFEIINPWTGKPKRMTLIVWKDMKSNFPLGWEIMPTEDTRAISSALRRAIMMLGKMPKVAYLDNGRAFRARHFEGCANFEEAGFAGLYERLGMKTIHAWPYHGQSKTVERFFGTFAELERWMPTFSGTSIATKPPRMNRGETLHRKAYDKAFGGRGITMEQAHRLIAGWFDEYIKRPQRGHLAGRAPLDLYLEEKGPGVDRAELTMLMMSMEIKHIRNSMIKFQGQNYYHPELYGRRHPVTIRYDLVDTSALWVFDEGGELLCMAEQTEKMHPAATALGTDEDREKLRLAIERRKSQEKEAGCLVRGFLEKEVLPEHQRMLEMQGLGPGAEIKARKPENKPVLLDASKVAAQVELITRDTAASEAAAMNRGLEEATEGDRCEMLLEMTAKGQVVTRRWRNWLEYYRATPEYERNREYYEQREAVFAIMYQAEADSGS